MKIHDLVRVCTCLRKDLLKNIDFIMGYSLFRIILVGKDEIPEIGSAEVISKDGKSFLQIELAEKWQKILNNEDISDILVKQLQEYYDEKKGD